MTQSVLRLLPPEQRGGEGRDTSLGRKILMGINMYGYEVRTQCCTHARTCALSFLFLKHSTKLIHFIYNECIVLWRPYGTNSGLKLSQGAGGL